MLGIWGPPAAEGARHWPSVLAELKNRGVRDVFFPVRDGLKGLPDAVGVVWPEAVVQMCIIHLMRNTFRHASRACVLMLLYIVKRLGVLFWVGDGVDPLDGPLLEFGKVACAAFDLADAARGHAERLADLLLGDVPADA